MLKIGDAASIIFLDHCKCPGGTGQGPVLFEAIGRVVAIKKEYYTLAPWINPDLSIDGNTETYVILRSTIKTEKRLK